MLLYLYMIDHDSPAYPPQPTQQTYLFTIDSLRGFLEHLENGLTAEQFSEVHLETEDAEHTMKATTATLEDGTNVTVTKKLELPGEKQAKLIIELLVINPNGETNRFTTDVDDNSGDRFKTKVLQPKSRRLDTEEDKQEMVGRELRNPDKLHEVQAALTKYINESSSLPKTKWHSA